MHWQKRDASQSTPHLHRHPAKQPLHSRKRSVSNHNTAFSYSCVQFYSLTWHATIIKLDVSAPVTAMTVTPPPHPTSYPFKCSFCWCRTVTQNKKHPAINPFGIVHSTYYVWILSHHNVIHILVLKDMNISPRPIKVSVKKYRKWFGPLTVIVRYTLLYYLFYIHFILSSALSRGLPY